MPNSENDRFYVDIIRKGEFKALTSGKKVEKTYGCLKLKSPFKFEAQHYICVEQDAAFQIRIKTPNRDDEKTYGAVLYLDGQRIHGKKTFRGSTNFLGYKLGGGAYTEFVFSIPQMQEEDENPLLADESYGCEHRPVMNHRD